MSENSQIELLIPKNTTFKTIRQNGEQHIYQCNLDIKFRISNPYIFFECQDNQYVLSTKMQHHFNIAKIEIHACHNQEIYQVNDLERLENEKYDVPLCLDDNFVMCQNMQICAKNINHFWKIGRTADLCHNTYTLVTDMNLSKRHLIISELVEQDIPFMDNDILYVKKNSELKFGKQQYKLCHDLAIKMKHSCISSYSTICYHLSNTIQDVCTNPFQSGEVIAKVIQLQDQNEFILNITVDIFKEKVTSCRFHAENLSYTKFPELNFSRIKYFEWHKLSSQKYFDFYEIKQKFQPLLSNPDPDVSKIASELMCDEYSDWTTFLKRSIYLSARANQLELMQYLIIKYLKPEFNPKTIYMDVICQAIQHGNLAMLQFLIGMGVDIALQGNLFLELAIKSGCLPIVTYLVHQGATLGNDFMNCLELAMQKNDYQMVKYLESLPEYESYRKRLIMQEFDIINKAFEKISRLA